MQPTVVTKMKDIIYSILLVIWTQLLPGITGLECYYCRSFELTNYQHYNYTDAVVPILMQMRDPRCRMGNFATSDQNNQYNNQNNMNNNQNLNNNQNINNNYNYNDKPLTRECDPLMPGTRTKKTMCVTYEGMLTTRIANNRYNLRTTTMDCKEVDINAYQQSYQRNGIAEDNFYFEKLMYQFRDQIFVQNFDGNMHACYDKSCQLYSTGATILCSVFVVVSSLVMSYLTKGL